MQVQYLTVLSPAPQGNDSYVSVNVSGSAVTSQEGMHGVGWIGHGSEVSPAFSF